MESRNEFIDNTKVEAFMNVVTEPSHVESNLIQSSLRVLGTAYSLELLTKSSEMFSRVNVDYIKSISLEIMDVYIMLHEEIGELMISPLKELANILITFYQILLEALISTVGEISDAYSVVMEGFERALITS
ncbi:TPA: hypothetical protein O4I98_001337 [Vibrio parahaemolyticus]|nr:hypothetical protein [Vibrio parahaemolyticus]